MEISTIYIQENRKDCGNYRGISVLAIKETAVLAYSKVKNRALFSRNTRTARISIGQFKKSVR